MSWNLAQSSTVSNRGSRKEVEIDRTIGLETILRHFVPDSHGCRYKLAIAGWVAFADHKESPRAAPPNFFLGIDFALTITTDLRLFSHFSFLKNGGRLI